MKPTLHFPEIRHRRDTFGTATGVRFPKTDYCFRAPSDFDGSYCRGDGSPSFRRISKAYFDAEAGKQFVLEASFFALIVITAAVPVFKGISGLFQLAWTSGVL